MRKNQPISFILEIQQILVSQDLKDHAYFWSSPSKNHESNLVLNFYKHTKNQFMTLFPSGDTILVSLD